MEITRVMPEKTALTHFIWTLRSSGIRRIIKSPAMQLSKIAVRNGKPENAIIINA
jgi:hypothetical protein